MASERSISWARLIPHYPVYYLDFPHLREIITNNKNWDPVFKRMFTRREVFDGNFVELEAIRNRIAHNRKLSKTDIMIARAVHSVFVNSLGRDRFQELAARCTRKEDFPAEINELRRAAEGACQQMLQITELADLHTWQRIASEWWFDDDYLGSNVDAVRNFFGVCERYNALPRGRGLTTYLQNRSSREN